MLRLKTIGVEGHEDNQWVLVDFGDIVVHIMDKESRDKYQLEDFWKALDLSNLRNICKISMSLKLTLNFFGGRSPSWIEEGRDVYLKRLSGSMEISVKEQGLESCRISGYL